MTTYGGRGKELEKKVNATNLKYRMDRLAIIYQVPLPVQITNKGLLPQTSIVDYMGSKGPAGKAVAFDAKETQKTTSFPLANIHDHQLVFLDYFYASGGEAAFLIWFKNLHDTEAFWTPYGHVKDFMDTETRKSLPYKWFRKEWLVPIDDYLNLLGDDDND